MRWKAAYKTTRIKNNTVNNANSKTWRTIREHTGLCGVILELGDIGSTVRTTYLVVGVRAVQMMGVQGGRDRVGAQFRVPV